jgi:hypothetical protein
MLEFKVLNWNVAGAKYFTIESDTDKDRFRADVNKHLQKLVDRHDPHVITLQEIVEYARPGELDTSLIDPPAGYTFSPSILIDSRRHPYVAKWQNAARSGGWPYNTYFGQGLGVLWRDDLAGFRHFPVWSVPGPTAQPDGKSHVEEVILMSGLYFGDRDTEPRAAAVSHFVISNDLRDSHSELPKALDVFVVNLHLTTLKGEREGIPQIDGEATVIRSHQVDIILNGIVSRYNKWRNRGYRSTGFTAEPNEGDDFKRYSPIWILCGDFNFTPDSLEYQRVKGANFVDVCPNKGSGSKGSGFGSLATLTVDYILVGPKFVSLDPVVVENAVVGNPTPDTTVRVSDHYPLYATIPFTPR